MLALPEPLRLRIGLAWRRGVDSIKRPQEPPVERQSVVLNEREWVARLWIDIDANDFKASLGVSFACTAGAAEEVEKAGLAHASLRFSLISRRSCSVFASRNAIQACSR
jgi:hypothetical protein